jgi:hypothetical protein
MALPVPPQSPADVGETTKPLDAQAALAIADGFLIDKVGDLLSAQAPRLSPDGRWLMSITVGNALQGTLGEVGSIAVDASSGEVLFSDEERAKVKARARELATAAVP